jgi:methionyl-tRNA synthetase
VTIIGREPDGEPEMEAGRLHQGLSTGSTTTGGKFSTSQKRGVFTDQALELLPADYWRWYLIANAPESSDANFTWEHFASTVNKDLADVLGNFVNRVLKFAAARFDGVVPDEETVVPAQPRLPLA